MKRQKRPAISGELQAVSRSLREIWDPIGLGDIRDLPSDEYDSYAPVVLSLIQTGASDREVAKYLAKVEAQTMGLTARSLTVLEFVAAQVRAAAITASARA